MSAAVHWKSLQVGKMVKSKSRVFEQNENEREKMHNAGEAKRRICTPHGSHFLDRDAGGGASKNQARASLQ